MDNVIIGKSVVITGELTAKEDLTIEGLVDGKIELGQNVLTIGQNAPPPRPRRWPRQSSSWARLWVTSRPLRPSVSARQPPSKVTSSHPRS